MRSVLNEIASQVSDPERDYIMSALDRDDDYVAGVLYAIEERISGDHWIESDRGIFRELC